MTYRKSMILPRFVSAQEAEYEEKIVKVLLKRYRIPNRYKFKMLDEADRRWGSKTLTMSLFLEFFPTFPVALTAKYLSRVTQRCSVADLFVRFGKTELVRRYEGAMLHTVGKNPSKPFGLVYYWPQIKGAGGGLVLHNHPIDTRVTGSRLLFASTRGQLVMEPSNVLLDTIDSAVPGGKGWQPKAVVA
jgi:hypothetical protein